VHFIDSILPLVRGRVLQPEYSGVTIAQGWSAAFQDRSSMS